VLWQLQARLRHEIQIICNRPCSRHSNSCCHWRLSHQPPEVCVCVIGRTPLSVLINLLLCNYVAKLATKPKHPTHASAFHPTSCDRYEFLTWDPRPVGVRLQNLLQRLGIKLPHTIRRRVPKVALWHVVHRACDLRLTRCTRGIASALAYRRYFAELLSAYPDHTVVCSDGSFIQAIDRQCFHIWRPGIPLPPQF
jgi:hypothetical protein